MKDILKIIVIAVLLPTFLYSCGGGGQQAPAQPAKTDVQTVEKKAEEPLAPVVVSKAEAPLKNPFQSYIMTKKNSVEEGKEIKGPLECCDLKLFKVMASMLAGDSTYALLSAPDGKRYIVKVGDKIGLNSGKIADIDAEGIVVKEPVKDLEGNIVSSVITELKLLGDEDKSGGKPKRQGSPAPAPRGR